MSTRFLAIFALTALVLTTPSATTAQGYDVLIRNGTVIDGTGAPGYKADVAISGDRIVAISRTPIDAALARTVIDATGRVVTPGFIDNHSHTQLSIADDPLSENFLRQGITTMVASLHSGDQPSPRRPTWLTSPGIRGRGSR